MRRPKRHTSSCLGEAQSCILRLASNVRLHMKLRRGVPTDIPALDHIAVAAKAHWGYSAQQLALWSEDLAVSMESLHLRPVCVAEVDNTIIGFAQVATDVQPWELWAMWVHPSQMGKGIGKTLLEWAREFAAAGGQAELAVDSDPHAEGFYKALGARVVGTVAAPIAGNPERVRPQLRLSTGAT